MKAIMLAAAAIKAGDAEVVVAGGMESMSQGPYLLPKARFGYRFGHGQLRGLDDLRRAVVRDRGLPHGHARRAGRAQRARLACRPGRVRAREPSARGRGRGRGTVRGRAASRCRSSIAKTGEERLVDGRRGAASRHEPRGARPAPARLRHARPTTRRARPARSRPGTRRASTTARPPRSSRERARSSDTGSARSRGSSATRRREWRRAGSSSPRSKASDASRSGPGSAAADYDLVEINEAFAAQTLADGRALGLDWDRVNVNGGAIALGHPIGASGARIVTTLAHELRRREGRYGLATLCLGGGGSVAMAIERVALIGTTERAVLRCAHGPRRARDRLVGRPRAGSSCRAGASGRSPSSSASVTRASRPAWSSRTRTSTRD